MPDTTPLPPLAFQRENGHINQVLVRASQAYLAQRGDHRFADGGMFAKVLVLILLCAFCYYASLRQHNGWAYFGWYAGFIFSAMMLTVNVVHDASHNAFFKRASLNHWLNFFVSMPLGLDADCWRVRHVIFHHAYNNIEGYDPDIEANGVLRQTPFQRRKAFMRVQQYYWPLVAALTFPYYIWLFDWLDRAGKTRITPKMRLQGAQGWGMFLLSKLAHFTLALVIPLWLMSPVLGITTVLLVYLLSQMLSSLVFVMLIVGTHWAKARFYQAPAVQHGWYQHVFSTTFDWQTSPQWLGYWLGGANLHLTHHLFPHWSHRHYPALARIIADVAAQYGLDYQCLDLKTLLVLQQRFLAAMGRKP
ncbi:linoleoyl-CoA desaturase [Chania multitudinisentens RB-25]|uniref:Linoleoyl-CoA desaturase n=1 Tax=Chania multitudinisentens RB-25 TaxID=1441930 RepID=W0LEF3_9GAMM|nr:linoleoyl-CoA desaturase [Chania multitudinisentens RB-25]